MISSLFTYGTLEIPSVMEAVTGRSFGSLEASIEGYERLMIKHQIYPGMIACPSGMTVGRLYVHVDARSLNLIDEFEDDVYIRETIRVNTCEGNSVTAYAYILSSDHRNILSSEPWRREYFVVHHLSQYVVGCRAFHHEVSIRINKNSNKL